MNTDEELAGLGEARTSVEELQLAMAIEALLRTVVKGKQDESLLSKVLNQAEALPGDTDEVARILRFSHECAVSLWESLNENILQQVAEDKNVPLADAASPKPTFPNPFPDAYRIAQLLGEGMFGKVWLAEDLRLARHVALKTLNVSRKSTSTTQKLAALETEAKLLARIDHPNIVRVHAWLRSGDEHYLVLQYVPGQSLAKRLKSEKRLPWDVAARYIADIADGLLAVHRCGIVHRDIKPANMLWDSERDEALLTDFGLSTLVGANHRAGSPGYMAPEAWDGLATPATDVYALSVSLFELIVGEWPFSGRTRDELRHHSVQGLPDPDHRLSQVPAELDSLIRMGLAGSPDNRPTSNVFADRLRGSLNRLLGDSLVQSVQETDAALEMTVYRDEFGSYRPIEAAEQKTATIKRGMRRVPKEPRRVQLRTGDIVRIDVTSRHDGYLTVFNVSPAGNMNLLFPENLQGPDTTFCIRADQPLIISDIVLEPPAGKERLLAVWMRDKPPSDWAQLFEVSQRLSVSPEYCATRDMKRMQKTVRSLSTDACVVAALELDHEQRQQSQS